MNCIRTIVSYHLTWFISLAHRISLDISCTYTFGTVVGEVFGFLSNPNGFSWVSSQALRNIFALFDVSGDGFLSPEDHLCALRPSHVFFLRFAGRFTERSLGKGLGGCIAGFTTLLHFYACTGTRMYPYICANTYRHACTDFHKCAPALYESTPTCIHTNNNLRMHANIFLQELIQLSKFQAFQWISVQHWVRCN